MSRLPVSLYIPCYNGEKFIESCLQGVFSQTCLPGEIIVIDDGSIDASVRVASQYPVKVISNRKNSGLGVTRNLGFKSARYELVAALDADTVPHPDWLVTLSAHFKSNPRLAGAGGKLIETGIHGIADLWRRVHMSQDWGKHVVLNPRTLFGNNGLYRKSAVIDVGGFDETLKTNGEDRDLSQKLADRGYETIYDPSAKVNHLRTDTIKSVLETRWRWDLPNFTPPDSLPMLIQKLWENYRKMWRFIKQDLKSDEHATWLLSILMYFVHGGYDVHYLIKRQPGRVDKHPSILKALGVTFCISLLPFFLLRHSLINLVSIKKRLQSSFRYKTIKN